MIAHLYRIEETLDKLSELPDYTRGYLTGVLVEVYKDGLFSTGNKKYPYGFAESSRRVIDYFIEQEICHDR